LCDLLGSRGLASNIVGVDRDYIRDQDGRGITVPESWCGRFSDDIFGECFLSFDSFALAKASAAFELSVEDAPDRPLKEAAVWGAAGTLQPEARAFTSTRHSFLISLIEPRVV
jgi:hypothetical protein